MSTNDVPGASPANKDELRAGCWAEHDDGSLIYVKGTERGSIVYEIYDMAMEPAVCYTDAMPETGFKKQFSYPPVGASKEKWTWHDKTPFDWRRVMKVVERPRPGHVSAEETMSAAARVAESLRLRGKEVVGDLHRHKSPEEVRGTGAGRALEKIGAAIKEFLRDDRDERIT